MFCYVDQGIRKFIIDFVEKCKKFLGTLAESSSGTPILHPNGWFCHKNWGSISVNSVDKQNCYVDWRSFLYGKKSFVKEK